MTTSAVIPQITFAGSSGSGTLGPFSLIKSGTPIYFTANSQIKVYRYDTTTDTAPTLLVEGTDYDLTGGPNAGSITLTSPQTGLLTAERLFVYREQPITQSLDLGFAGNFSSGNIEARLDRTYEIIYELRREVQSAVRFSLFDTDNIPNTLPLGAVIDKLFYISGTTSAPTLATIDSPANLLANIQLTADNITNINLVGSDLGGADTIGIVAADLDGDNTVGTVAGNIASVVAVAGVVADFPTILAGLNVRAYQAATKTALKAIVPVAGDVAILHGNGIFQWDASNLSTEITADPRGGIYIPPSTDATGASGAWIRLGFSGNEPWELEASWFAADADTSDSAAVQAAVDAALNLNRSAVIRVRQWQFDTTVTIDLSARTQDAVEQELPVINFKGDGDGVSWIELTAATCALEYLGGTGAGGHSFIDWEGFSIRPDLSTVSARTSGTVGIRLNNCAYWNFSDIEFAYLALGLDGIDILSGNGHQCFFRLNTQHMYVRGGTYEGEANYSHPNAIGWADTLFAGSTKVSIVKGCANFLLQGGTVEGNGSSYTAGGLTATMNAATQAAPCVITTTSPHGISAGDYIRISGVAGMTELNDLVFVATSVTSTTITLEDTAGAAIDATGYTAYSSGGTVTQLGGAFLFVDCGVQGGVAVKADGVYVEGQSGLADFIIDHTTSERAQYVFIANTFQRYSASAYTKHHLSFASSTSESRMALLANAFESISPYTDDGARPYWEAGVADVYEFANLIQDPALVPQSTLTPDSAAALYTSSQLSGLDAGRWEGSEVRVSDGTLDGNGSRAYSNGSTWINVAEKIYRFRVTWSGSAYSATLPSGWSLTTEANNTCTITHGLGSTEYVVMAMVGGTTAARLIESAHATTQTQIALYNTSNTLVGDHFNFQLVVT